MDPILAQIILWPASWIPQGWLACNGQLLPVSQYAALFSILGTTYGGDGRVNFALPNLNGRVPVGVGQLSGTNSNYQLGQTGGSESTTLTVAQMPPHSHPASGTLSGGTAIGKLPSVTVTANSHLNVSASVGTTNTPSATNVPSQIPSIAVSASLTKSVTAYGPADANTQWPVATTVTAAYDGGTNQLTLPVSGGTVGVVVQNNGGGSPIDNRQPFMGMNYIIAVEGVYPSRP